MILENTRAVISLSLGLSVGWCWEPRKNCLIMNHQIDVSVNKLRYNRSPGLRGSIFPAAVIPP